MYLRAPTSAAAPLLPLLLCFVNTVNGHGGHHADLPEGEHITAEPLDSILWIHIILMGVSFGIIFPLGMVLGIVRSRWHVPVQVVGTAVAILAYFLGHAHGGRQFAPNIHAAFATSLMLMLALQVILGVYLKLHLSRGIHVKLRPWAVRFHGIVGKAMPIASWIQMIFGGITALGFCHDDHLGQCLAHFIMGSAFIAYGILLTILLLVGQFWLRRTGRSQEFFDSIVIAVWGCINTFTEHRWGQEWAHNDYQHTSMGIVWWCAGLLGIWLSRKRNGRPKRNLVPGIVILLTGYAMSAHSQELMLSTMVHAVFGYTLMAAGAARIIEIAFVLGDRSTLSPDGTEANSFQYLTPFLLCASGFLFMGATEEQMELLAGAGLDHVSYILVLYSTAFFLFLFVNVLIHIYAVSVWPETASASKPGSSRKTRLGSKSRRGRSNRNRNGTATADGDVMNGHVRTPSEAQRVRDAEAFELEGLMSDEGEDILDVNDNRRDEENIPLVGRGGVDPDAVEMKDAEGRR